MTGTHLKEGLLSWVVGSLALGVLVGGLGAVLTAAALHLKKAANQKLRGRIRFVNRAFARCPWFDRGCVRWKLRLDKIFGLIAAQGLGLGPVVDLGCGYGMALCFAAFDDTRRRLLGCDLNAHRIAVARQALSALNAEVVVADVRSFEVPPAALILILDVLQYLSADEQRALLERCCSALMPQGRLIFRVHDVERGFWSTITMAFDRLLFSCERTGSGPLMLSAGQYQSVLEGAGMNVESRRFRNRLPLAHILYIATRPRTEPAP